MQKYINNVTTNKGVAIPGASVLVKTLAGAVATIYSVDGVTTTANPLTTDANGMFSFYAADGHYSLTISKTGIATQTITDVLLEDPADDGSVGVKRFGAVGDGVADDTAAIQAAINYAIYTASPKIGTVVFPPGSYKISDTLHMGYGTGFTSITLEGDGSSYGGESGFGGTRIIPTFSDRPAINVQGARRARIRKLAILGLNNTYVKNAGLGGTGAVVDDTAVAAWIDPALNANANSRYAPYAGITVDAYSGAAPAPAYPAVTYPAFLGAVAQYNKNFSSGVVIEDCVIAGFVVGVVVQPGNSDGNGDFVSLRDTSISYCAYGVSVGQSQSRLVNFYNGAISSVHTCFVNNVHGKQIGKFGGVISGAALEGVIQLFDMNTGSSGPLLFDGCYGELVWRIGNTNTAAAGSFPYLMNACEFAFLSHPAIRGVPKLLVEGGGNNITVRGGSLGLPSIGAFAGGMKFDGTLVIASDMSGASTSRNLAQRASGGIIPLGLQIVQDEGLELRTNATTGQIALQKNAAPGGRTKTLGRLAQSVQWREVAASSAPVSCARILSQGSVAANPLVIAGLSGTIDLTATNPPYGIRAGDLIQHDTTGTVFLVTSNAGLIASVTALNNYSNPGSGNALRTAVAGGNWYVLNARMYSTTYPLYGTLTSGSAVMTNVNRGDGYGAYIGTDLAVGDFLFQPVWTSNYFASNVTITAIDSAARTITLSVNAGATVTAQPFHFWVQG